MKKLTPIKAIRAKCIDCSAGMLSHIKNCPCVSCSLYPYRMGRRPRNKVDSPKENSTDHTLEHKKEVTGIKTLTLNTPLKDFSSETAGETTISPVNSSQTKLGGYNGSD